MELVHKEQSRRVYAEGIIHLYHRVMNHAHSHKVGLAVGGTVAIMHAAWSLVVFAGLAESLLKWIWGLHFISMSVTVLPFSLSTALMLVVVTGAVGYVAGYVAGELWGCAGKGK